MVGKLFVKKLSENLNYSYRPFTLFSMNPSNRHCVAATCDLWSDDMVKRSYLDFTVFWTDDDYQLHHCLLRCKHFPNETKTAINIWNEIEQIFQEFGLSFGDTPLVTDQGANMVAAFKLTGEARFPCMAHRCCNTTIETAWNRLDTNNTQFHTFNTTVKDIRKYVQQSGGIQEHLEKTIKSTSSTRPWRSLFQCSRFFTYFFRTTIDYPSTS